MDFFKAMQYMKDGQRIKIKGWPENTFIGVREEEMKVFGKKKIKYSVINSDETDISPLFPFSFLVNSDWDLVDED